MRTAVYDRKAVVAYANRYALQYNQDYANWAGSGGDCANFISQCLYAGGVPMQRTGTWQWYYNTPGGKYTNATSSWKGAQSLRIFVKHCKELPRLPIQFLSSPYGLEAGDIVWALNDDGTGKASRTAHHVALVNHVTDDGIIYIYGHTADKRNEKWSYPDKDTLYGKLDDLILFKDEEALVAGNPDQRKQPLTLGRELRYQDLSRHMEGEDVRMVQNALARAGYDPGNIDGFYGPLTCHAVAAFQRDHSIYTDVIVGSETMKKLLEKMEVES